MSEELATPALVLPRSLEAHQSRGKRLPIESWTERVLPRLGLIGIGWRSRRARLRGLAAMERAAGLTALEGSSFNTYRREVAAKLRRRGLAGDALAEGLGLAAEASRRVLGLTPFAGQLAAAASLVAGEVAEMDTGEGKTLSAFLAAATCALAGRTVHVVTSNDYLAERDCTFLTPAFTFLALTTGSIIGGMTPGDRRSAYRADVTFLSGKEAAFDYLRDGLARGGDAPDRNTLVA